MSDAGALDPVIHQATRLRIVAALYRNRTASFTQLRDGLGLTDGNLASHAARLEQAGYVESRRALNSSLSFEVRYRITPAGAEAFRRYIASLTALLAEAGVADDVGRLGAEGAAKGGVAEPAF